MAGRGGLEASTGVGSMEVTGDLCQSTFQGAVGWRGSRSSGPRSESGVRKYRQLDYLIHVFVITVTLPSSRKKQCLNGKIEITMDQTIKPI